MRQSFSVIDADGHVTESDEQVRRYMEEPYRRRPTFRAGDQYWDRNLYGRLGRSAPDAETWLRAMDEGGLDTAVLFPTRVGLGASLIWEPDVAVAVSRAYNQFMYEEFLKRNDRLKAVALLPLQDIDAAVQELRRAVSELGMVGGMLPAIGLHRPLGHREFFPLYEEAQRLDTMLAVHSGTQGIHHVGADHLQKFIEVHTYCFPTALMLQITSMTFAGVPALFPNLRLGWMEAGCGWVPYWLERMDEEWEKRGDVEAPLLRKPPSEYVKDGHWFFHAEAEERAIPYVISVLGEDVLFYASDFPHWDSEFPENIDHMLAREDLTESVKRKLLAENAKRLYRI